jgi:hypothetical protein
MADPRQYFKSEAVSASVISVYLQQVLAGNWIDLRIEWRGSERDRHDFVVPAGFGGIGATIPQDLGSLYNQAFLWRKRAVISGTESISVVRTGKPLDFKVVAEEWPEHASQSTGCADSTEK